MTLPSRETVASKMLAWITFVIFFFFLLMDLHYLHAYTEYLDLKVEPIDAISALKKHLDLKTI